MAGVIDESCGAIAYVIDPARRQRGYGVDMVRTMMEVSALEHVSLFAAGIEPENTASVRCLLSAGFQPLHPVSDWEGIVYYTVGVEVAGHCALYIHCKEADRVADEWRQAGVEVNGPQDEEYGKREGFVSDPDGNVIRFGSPIR